MTKKFMEESLHREIDKCITAKQPCTIIISIQKTGGDAMRNYYEFQYSINNHNLGKEDQRLDRNDIDSDDELLNNKTYKVKNFLEEKKIEFKEKKEHNKITITISN